MNKKILLVYIEPTPYILDLIHALIVECTEQIDILFLTENLSQKWNVEINEHCRILPKHHIEKLKFIVNIFCPISSWTEN